jgi:uncharacterized membrane protein
MASVAVHILAGSVGLIAGYVALSAAKGAKLHRKSGMVFVYAMTTMALMGTMMALIWNVAPTTNGPVGLLTAYLVITALTTVRPPFAGSHRVDFGMMLVALGVGVTFSTFGFEALSSPKGTLNGMPAVPYFIFGLIGLLASAGDAWLIRAGGVQVVRDVPRIRRHLWRMSTALLIAAFSFFLGQAKVIPKPIRIFPLLAIPPLMVLVAMLYWLWRVRVRRVNTAKSARRPLAVSDPLVGV